MNNDSKNPGPQQWPGAFPEEGVAIVAGVVIETIPGEAPRVGARLASVEGLELVGGDGDRRLAGVWSASSGKRLLKSVETLLQQDEQLLGIFPTFIGREDEADAGEVGNGARELAEGDTRQR